VYVNILEKYTHTTYNVNFCYSFIYYPICLYFGLLSILIKLFRIYFPTLKKVESLKYGFKFFLPLLFILYQSHKFCPDCASRHISKNMKEQKFCNKVQ
jgi:hypothetical protein